MTKETVCIINYNEWHLPNKRDSTPDKRRKIYKMFLKWCEEQPTTSPSRYITLSRTKGGEGE
jgi:hypothetical protein